MIRPSNFIILNIKRNDFEKKGEYLIAIFCEKNEDAYDDWKKGQKQVLGHQVMLRQLKTNNLVWLLFLYHAGYWA